MTVHILNQYVWPDCAPTAIYADLLGACLQHHGYGVKVVGGDGCYRRGNRPRTEIERVTLPVWTGSRGRIFSTLREYQSSYAGLNRYIIQRVLPGDMVIATSAPPQSIGLIDSIQKRGALGIYWLQDYYPELLRGFWNYPTIIRTMLSTHWNHQLERWHCVVKIAGNLDYTGVNAVVIRNGPTLDPGNPQPAKPGQACYFGNLGYGHCLDSFLQTCVQLRNEGYTVTVVGDGPKAARLPSWIRRESVSSESELLARHWQAEVHLVAADPKITGAIFPSKYWNSRLTGRRIVPSGFAGPMLEEWRYVEELTEMPSMREWIPLLKKVMSSPTMVLGEPS